MQALSIKICSPNDYSKVIASNPKYENAADSWGFADPEAGKVFVRDLYFPELNKWLLTHEIEHILDPSNGADKDENGIYHKRGLGATLGSIGGSILGSVLMPGVGTVLGGALGGAAGGSIGAASAGRSVGKEALGGALQGGLTGAGSVFGGPIFGSTIGTGLGSAAGSAASGAVQGQRGLGRSALISGITGAGLSGLGSLAQGGNFMGTSAAENAGAALRGGSSTGGSGGLGLVPGVQGGAQGLGTPSGYTGPAGLLRNPAAGGLQFTQSSNIPPDILAQLNQAGPGLDKALAAGNFSSGGNSLNSFGMPSPITSPSNLFGAQSGAQAGGGSGFTQNIGQILGGEERNAGPTPPGGGNPLSRFFPPAKASAGGAAAGGATGGTAGAGASQAASSNPLDMFKAALPGLAVSQLGNILSPPPKAPDLGQLPSLQQLRGMAGQPISDIAKQATGVLSQRLSSNLPQEVTDSINRQFNVERQNMISQFKQFRPDADVATDSRFRQAMEDLDSRQSEAVANAQLNYRSQQAQDISTALGIDSQTLSVLTQLANADIQTVMTQLGLSAQEAQSFRQAFGQLGGQMSASALGVKY